MSAEKTKSFVSLELAKRLRKANTNDLIFAAVSENVEDICKVMVWMGEEEVCVSGDTFVFKHQQNGKYLAYQFRTEGFLEYKKRHVIGTKVTRLPIDKLAKFEIPLPSLAEQEHIVNILDRYDSLLNDLSARLPAEIAARRLQYEHYRNRLLTFRPMQREA